MVDFSKEQDQKAARAERDKAKRFRDEAGKKEQEIQKLRKEIDDDIKKAKAAGIMGPAGALLGAAPKSHAKQLEQKLKHLEHEAHQLQEKANFADKEAYKWEQKAKFAD